MRRAQTASSPFADCCPISQISEPQSVELAGAEFVVTNTITISSICQLPSTSLSFVEECNHETDEIDAGVGDLCYARWRPARHSSTHIGKKASGHTIAINLQPVSGWHSTGRFGFGDSKGPARS